MELLGQPFVIQNTVEHGWLVTWNDAVKQTKDGEVFEAISFTVALPRSADLTIGEVQTFALKRAAELLQEVIRHRQQEHAGR